MSRNDMRMAELHQAGEMPKNRFIRFCAVAAALLFLLFIGVTALRSLTLMEKLTVRGTYAEGVLDKVEALPHSLLLTGLALCCFFAGNALLRRLGVRLQGALLALWLAGSLIFIVGIRMNQDSDPAMLLQTARAFVAGDYSDLTRGYYMGSSYQLGMVLYMEAFVRFFPMLDAGTLMQCLNCVYAVGILGFLCALAQEVYGQEERGATLLLGLTCLPLWLYTVYAYGTMPMMLLSSLSFLLYVRYQRTGQIRLIVWAALLMALAKPLKENALVAQVALLILCALTAIDRRDARPPLLMLGSIALGIFLGQAVIWQYELRSGIKLIQNESKLTWLVMGLSEGGARSGWFNGYAGRFAERYLAPEVQAAEVRRDLMARLTYWVAHPARFMAFMKDKWFSQWLEPTVSTIARAAAGGWSGRYGGLAEHIYRDVTWSGSLVLGYMNTWQKAFYLLCTAGGIATLRESRQEGALARLMLPVAVFGGFVFHQLFEAKSQYVFPYLIYMLPIAAHGLCVIRRGISQRFSRRQAISLAAAKEKQRN